VSVRVKQDELLDELFGSILVLWRGGIAVSSARRVTSRGSNGVPKLSPRHLRRTSHRGERNRHRNVCSLSGQRMFSVPKCHRKTMPFAATASIPPLGERFHSRYFSNGHAPHLMLTPLTSRWLSPMSIGLDEELRQVSRFVAALAVDTIRPLRTTQGSVNCT
jgi:hypothetical protein